MKLIRFAIALLASALSSHALAQYTQVQWGINRTVASPFPLAINLSGTWVSVGTVSASGFTPSLFPTFVCPASQWVSSGAAGLPVCSQPAFSNLSGQATLAQLPTLAANTILANPTNAPAVPSAHAAPSCSAASEALKWTTDTGLGCNNAIAAASFLGITGGTSGGIPYFSGASTLASSAALTANLPVIGGGAGVAPSVGTRSGNTTQFVTTTGAQTSGDCVEIDANGNHIASGAPCGSGGGANVASMTALRALTAGQYPSVYLTGFYSLGDGGEGLFVWDGASSATDDNGTIIAPDVGSGRWLRVVNSTQPNVVWWGAKGNAKTYRPTVTISSGSPNLTVDAGTFAAGDIGKKITVQGAGAAGAVLATTIASVTDATHIALTANASTTVSGVLNFVQYGDDDAAAFIAAEAWAGARGGAEIKVPSAWFGIASTVNISHSGVQFVGMAGQHGQHDLGQQSVGPGLVAIDGGITMAIASSTSGAGNQRIDGVAFKQLNFYCGAAAAFGLRTYSLKFSFFHDLGFFECTSGNIDFNAVATLGEVWSNCQNSIKNLSTVNQRTSGFGLRLTGSVAAEMNTCLSTFENTMIMHNNGDGLQCVYADNNEFIRTFIFHVSGGTGHAMNLTGLDATHYCQGNHWYGLTIGNKDGSGGNLHSFANAQGNTIANYDSYNASPTPIEDAGTSLFWYYEIHAPNGH